MGHSSRLGEEGIKKVHGFVDVFFFFFLIFLTKSTVSTYENCLRGGGGDDFTLCR